MSKESPLNRKEAIKEDILEHLDGRRKMVKNNAGKYYKFSFSSLIF
jgi:hypothetical protein